MPKTWLEKLENGASPKVEVIEKPMMGLAAGAKLLISTPVEVRSLVAGLPPGRAVTIPQLRAELARRHGADVTCQLTTSIFLRIVAEAAWDEHLAGKELEEITPFWRIIGPKDPIAKKLRCGVDFLRNQRRFEGLAD